MDSSNQDTKTLFSNAIKTLIVVLGPSITLAKVRAIKELSVEDDGTITLITGAPKEVGKTLIDSFLELSTMVVHKSLQPLLEYVLLNNQASPSTPSPTPGDKNQNVQTQPSANQDAALQKIKNPEVSPHSHTDSPIA